MSRRRLDYVRVLGRIPCPECGRPDVAVRSDFTVYPHQGGERVGLLPCYGSHPEVTLSAMLRVTGLDVRPGVDRASVWIARDEWHNRRDAFEAENRGTHLTGGVDA